MVDYTLKLDIDETQLARKMKKVLGAGGGGIGQMFSVAGGTAVGMGAFAGASGARMERFQQNILRLQDLQLKKLEKQTEQHKQGILGKFGPTLVKLAGFAVGLQGVNQLRKMLIDSSPILQATLEVLKTSFNLVLRPLGDMLGLFFLPMALGFLQFAIPFYKGWAERLPAWLDASEAFWRGDAPEFFSKLNKAIGPNVGTDSNGEVVIKLPPSLFGETISNWLDPIGEAWKEFWDQEMVDLEEAWTTVSGWFKGAASTVNTWVGKAWIDLSTWFKDVANDATTWVQEKWDEVTQFFADAGGNASNWLRGEWKKVTDWLAILGSDTGPGGWLRTQWTNIINFFVDIHNKLQNFWNRLMTALGQKPRQRAPIQYQGSDQLGQNIQAFINRKGLGPKGFAEGGVISEPIIGVGRSGRSYTFGERGPETVVPGTGGGNTIIFNVHGITDAREFESKVRPMVMKWLRDSKANRGIL